ncbi:MAG: hypothetical protein ACLFTH_04500 [Candidatus Woesearchaeota archaeon]
MRVSASVLLVFMALLLVTAASASEDEYMEEVKEGDMSPMEAIMKMKADEETNQSSEEIEQEVNKTNANMLLFAKIFFKEYIEMGNPLPDIHLGKFYKDMLFIQGDSEILGKCLNSTIEQSRTEEFRNCLYNKTSTKNAKKYNSTISSIKNGVDEMSKHNMNFIGIPFVQEIIS